MKHIALCVVASAAFFAFVQGCNCAGPLTGVPGSLDGRVCDLATGAGLVNVGVDVVGPVERHAVTDGGGNYDVERLPVGTYHITAVYEGGTRAFDVDVVADVDVTQSVDTACRELPPPPTTGTLDGQICNRHTGTFVSDAAVIVVLPDSELTTTTDDEGRFEIDDVPVGPQVVQVRGDGYQRAFAADITAGATFTLDLADDCQPVNASEGGVVGSFCDASDTQFGGNLVGADVNVQSTSGAGEVWTDVTDTNGEFEVNGLPPGPYHVDVRKGDSFHYAEDVDVVAGQLAVVTDPSACGEPPLVGRIAGIVCDPAGGGLSGDASLSDADGVIASTQIDGGRFAFDQIPPGAYDVAVTGIDGSTRALAGVVVSAFETTFLEDVSDPAACPTPEQCRDFANERSETADGRIYFVVDKSGSMDNADSAGQQKWTSLKNAVIATTTALNDTVEFGLALFPDDELCAAGSEAVPLGADHADAIEQHLNAVQTPIGGTPTAATLAETRDTLAAFAGDGRPLAVVLATDGGPNCGAGTTTSTEQVSTTCRCTITEDQGQCAPIDCVDDANAIAEVGRLRDVGIKTFVIGVLGVNAFADVMNNMANAGGTARVGPTKYYAADDQAQLEDALAAIARSIVACHVDVADVDLTAQTSVAVSVGGQSLSRDPLRHNGWDITGAHTIDLFGAACDVAGTSTDDVSVHVCGP